MPFEPGAEADLRRAAREKAAALNQHVLGYGALAEAEWRAAGIADPDLAAMRRYRLDRIRAELKRRDYAGALLYDPVNIRYATDSHQHAAVGRAQPHPPLLRRHRRAGRAVRLFLLRAPVRPFRHGRRGQAGGVVDLSLWRRTDAAGGSSAGPPASPISSGEHGGGNRRIAVDHLDPEGVAELARLGIAVGNGEAVMENARLIKSPDEILCMRRAIVACEAAMGEMEAALKPGISENELWAELHRGNIARGGEWIETRLLSSGPRTNPWFQECSSRIIEAGDLVAFDTDLIGPYGFCADLSRTWLCGDGKPTNEQSRSLPHRRRPDRPQHRTDAARHLASAISSNGRKNPPRDCFPARYGVLYHGVGLADEYPTLPHAADWTDDTPDGVLEPGMVLCVESYIGRLGGHEGVKIEEQILITETGNEKLSRYPLDARLLGG